jgi:hypothetical protein
MPDTRIIIRNDTASNWAAESATNVAAGELAAKIDTTVIGNTTLHTVNMFAGVDSNGAAIDSCPLIATGVVAETTGLAEPEIVQTKPVVFEDIASKTDGTTVRWDDTNSKWVADAKVLSLDAYPTADGTVVYDATLGKFKVGAVVAATEIDGGSYP